MADRRQLLFCAVHPRVRGERLRTRDRTPGRRRAAQRRFAAVRRLRPEPQWRPCAASVPTWPNRCALSRSRRPAPSAAPDRRPAAPRPSPPKTPRPAADPRLPPRAGRSRSRGGRDGGGGPARQGGCRPQHLRRSDRLVDRVTYPEHGGALRGSSARHTRRRRAVLQALHADAADRGREGCRALLPVPETVRAKGKALDRSLSALLKRAWPKSGWHGGAKQAGGRTRRTARSVSTSRTRVSPPSASSRRRSAGRRVAPRRPIARGASLRPC